VQRCFLDPLVRIISLFSPFPSIVVFVDISKYKGVWSALPICDDKQLLLFSVRLQIF
jgi:hypothetical protein